MRKGAAILVVFLLAACIRPQAGAATMEPAVDVGVTATPLTGLPPRTRAPAEEQVSDRGAPAPLPPTPTVETLVLPARGRVSPMMGEGLALYEPTPELNAQVAEHFGSVFSIYTYELWRLPLGTTLQQVHDHYEQALLENDYFPVVQLDLPEGVYVWIEASREAAGGVVDRAVVLEYYPPGEGYPAHCLVVYGRFRED